MGVVEKVYYSKPGKAVASKAGLKPPARLRRGDAWPEGPIVLASIGGGTLAGETLSALGRSVESPIIDDDAATPPGYGSPIGAVVVDATKLIEIGQLEDLRAVLRPALRSLEPSGRVVFVTSAATEGWEAATVLRSLDGIMRTVGKELRKGATITMLKAGAGVSAADFSSTLDFALTGRSAFVNGQAWTVAAGLGPVSGEADAPLAGRTVVVTGAARGIGADIARTVASRGATVVAVDIPAAGEALAAVANEIEGTAVQLDITAADAGETIAAHVAGRGGDLYGIVHNAGITRDKLLVNTDAARWASVIDVNLAAQMRINDVLLAPGTAGGLADGGRIVGVASTSGLGGNKGQANYAASKAGVAGLVAAMAPDLEDRRITVNAVAPGFIVTDMTAKIPFVQREIFSRSNSLDQGGRPVDVAETIAYLLDPRSQGVNGQVIRVCGQLIVGA